MKSSTKKWLQWVALYTIVFGYVIWQEVRAEEEEPIRWYLVYEYIREGDPTGIWQRLIMSHDTFQTHADCIAFGHIVRRQRFHSQSRIHCINTPRTKQPEEKT